MTIIIDLEKERKKTLSELKISAIGPNSTVVSQNKF